MPDKEAFVKELVRVTTPGGRVIIVTWCHRELKSSEVCSDFSNKVLSNYHPILHKNINGPINK